MNDVLYQLYAIKSNQRHLVLAHPFDGSWDCLQFRLSALSRAREGSDEQPATSAPPPGATAGFISAMLGTAATTRYLLDHGADPTIAGTKGSALHGVVMLGQYENVELLLSRGMDVDIFHSVHGTALHIAASKGEAGLVKLLLEHHADAGADPNFEDYNGVTYTMVAADNG